MLTQVVFTNPSDSSPDQRCSRECYVDSLYLPTACKITALLSLQRRPAKARLSADRSCRYNDDCLVNQVIAQATVQ